VKAPARTPAAKAKAAKAAAGGKAPKTAARTPGQVAAADLGAARRETLAAHHETGLAAKARAEAAKANAEAKAELAKGNRAAAGRDQARARRDTARAARETSRARKDIAKARAYTAKARTVTLAQPGAVADGWILGGNDWHLGCAAVAVANSLLLSSGLRVSDQDVLDLYLAASGGCDTGASVRATLEATAEYGLAGMRIAGFRAIGLAEVNERAMLDGDGVELISEHEGQLHAFHLGQLEHLDHVAVALLDDHPPDRTEPGALSPLDGDGGHVGGRDPALVLVHAGQSSGLILDLTLHEAQQDQDVWDWEPSPEWGAHAGVLAGGSVITWGREVPITPEFLDWQVAGAWCVEWPPLGQRFTG
jgi:hypothetical protein